MSIGGLQGHEGSTGVTWRQQVQRPERSAALSPRTRGTARRPEIVTEKPKGGAPLPQVRDHYGVCFLDRPGLPMVHGDPTELGLRPLRTGLSRSCFLRTLEESPLNWDSNH